MKKIILLTCMLGAPLFLAAAETKPKDPVHIISSRMDVFYFKIEKELLGAELEIYDRAGEKILTQTLGQRKVLVDFYFEKPGEYIIHLKKDNIHKEYNFRKDTPCPPNEKSLLPISVIQGV